MFKGRTLFLFTIAFLLASSAAWIARIWVENYTHTAAATAPATVNVLVAATEISYGQRIEATHLKTLAWPLASVPEQAVQDPAEIVGRIATQAVYPGELIVRERLRTHLGGSALSALIRPHLRAVSVRVNDVSGVGGFLLPGNRVDVLVAYRVEERTHSDLILQDIKVLAVDQEAAMDKEKPQLVRAVTLEMSPQQAQTLTRAMTEGTIQLALRNPLDDSQEDLSPPPPLHSKPPQPASQAVTLLKGTHRFIVRCGAVSCSEPDQQKD